MRVATKGVEVAKKKKATPVGEIRLTGLSKLEAKEWRRIRPLLAEVGIQAIDESIVRVYLRSWQIWFEASELLDAEGIMIETPKGFLQPNPAVTIIRQQSELLKKLCQELLISPGARKRVKVEIGKKEEEDDLF